MSRWRNLNKPVRIRTGQWPKPGEMGANPMRECIFQLVTKLNAELVADRKLPALAPGQREARALKSKPVRPKWIQKLATDFKNTTQGKQLIKQLQKTFYKPALVNPTTPATLLRDDVPDHHWNVKEIYSSCCLAFAWNHLFGGHFFHSLDEVLKLLPKVTNRSYDSYLVELVTKRGTEIPLKQATMPYKRWTNSNQISWVGFEKRTIDNFDEVVHYTHDPVAFNTLLT